MRNLALRARWTRDGLAVDAASRPGGLVSSTAHACVICVLALAPIFAMLQADVLAGVDSVDYVALRDSVTFPDGDSVALPESDTAADFVFAYGETALLLGFAECHLLGELTRCTTLSYDSMCVAPAEGYGSGGGVYGDFVIEYELDTSETYPRFYFRTSAGNYGKLRITHVDWHALEEGDVRQGTRVRLVEYEWALQLDGSRVLCGGLGAGHGDTRRMRPARGAAGGHESRIVMCLSGEPASFAPYGSFERGATLLGRCLSGGRNSCPVLRLRDRSDMNSVR